MIFLITPTFLLMQDILGKKDDKKSNQKRILFSDSTNKIFFYCSLATMSSILLLNNVESFLCYICLFITTLGYAAAKHFRKMAVSYSFRYLSSVFTFLLYIFLLVDGLLSEYYLIIALVSILDLVGNIAGDIRDTRKDTLAGVKTLVTKYSRESTLQIMSIFAISIFGIFIIYFKSFEMILLLLGNIIPFILIDSLPTKLSHGIFHLAKLINFLLISFLFSNISLLIFIIVFSFIIFAWSFSYYFYLYNTGSQSHA
jgi:hypothetical protein